MHDAETPADEILKAFDAEIERLRSEPVDDATLADRLLAPTRIYVKPLLALLEARLHNERAAELAIAAEEQRRILTLRLEKML